MCATLAVTVTRGIVTRMGRDAENRRQAAREGASAAEDIKVRCGAVQDRVMLMQLCLARNFKQASHELFVLLLR
jgi:hypothetical protein